MHSCEETIGNADTNPVSRNRRNTMKLLKTIGLMAILLMAFSPLKAGVMPEMQECMHSHGSREQYCKVLQKYCGNNMIRRAMSLLVIKNPYVIKTEKIGTAIYYTVQGTTVETSHEISTETTQIYRVCWDSGKIVSLKFLGGQEAEKS
jgi:hypothetical protein